LLIFIKSLFSCFGQSCVVSFIFVIHLSSNLCFYLSIVSFLISFSFSPPYPNMDSIRYTNYSIRSQENPAPRLFLSRLPTLLLAAFVAHTTFLSPPNTPFPSSLSKPDACLPLTSSFHPSPHISLSHDLEFSPLRS